MAETNQILKLAAIIREVGDVARPAAAALAELILDHPSFCECHQLTPPSDGEVAELVTWLEETGDTIQPSHLAEHQRYKRTAELLQRQALVPVPEVNNG